MPEPNPVRGELWWVEFESAVGSEANSTRPAIVISTPAFDHLPIRVVVPLTSWQERFGRQRNKVLIRRTDLNGLDLDSAADVLHVRGVSLQRFRTRVGVVQLDAFAALMTTLAVALDLTAP